LVFALFVTIFVGSSAGYAQVQQADMINKIQTWIGILGSTALLVIQLLIFLLIKPLVYKARDTRISGVYYALPERGLNEHPELAGMLEDDVIIGRPRATRCGRFGLWLKAFFVPRGEQPYRSFVVAIRFLNIIAIIFNLPLLVYVIITSRIMQPCEIHWTQ